jgi:glycosyltransferase involved in cell wall biosynthesis
MNRAVLMPVFNEESTVGSVIDQVRAHFAGPIIVVDDGSTDGTPEVLESRGDVTVITLPENRGYGFALTTGFAHALATGVEALITMDCDGQHEPTHIPQFFEALTGEVDVMSGSRYLPQSRTIGSAPGRRREVNRIVTEEINSVTGWGITDAFCGFKAYRVASLEDIEIEEAGYAMPLEFWARAYRAGLRIREMPVERIYCDYDRSFGTGLDDPLLRLEYYLAVWHRALREG